MDDALYGKRDKAGYWRPFQAITYPQVFVWPVKPFAILKWIPEYFWPWNSLYAAVGILFWLYLSPSLETTRTFTWNWILFIFARNVALVVVFFGAYHVRLYVQKAQGISFKFNARWPERNNPTFLFGNQNLENLFWTFISGVPIWTAYEAVTLWLFANGYIGMITWQSNPVWFAVLMLLVPLWREVHFYCIHRLIHWPPLYRWVHKLHHNNINPAPFSGLSMHPVEHLFYFSAVVLHWIVPSHPVHAIFNLVHLGLAPAGGHTGYERIVLGEDKSYDSHCYAHYLHHKFFECNYADGTIPLDRWFGSFHDGTDEAEERMNKRFIDRHARKARS